MRRGACRSLYSDDLSPGDERLQYAGHSAIRTAPADGYEDEIEIGAVLNEFEGSGALAGNDIRVIEGVDENLSLPAPGAGLLEALGEIVPEKRHLSPIGLGRLLLGEGANSGMTMEP